MKLKITPLFSLVALAATAATPALAGSLPWNFYTLTGMPASPGSTTWSSPWSTQPTASTSASFTQNGFTLFAAAATSSGCGSLSWCPGSGDLYAKNGGAGEQGLGLTNDVYPSNEISNPNGIYLAISQGSFSSVQLGSVQSGETWSVWGTNASGGLSGWTELGSGTGGGQVNFSLAGYDQVIISDPYLYNQTGGTQSNDIVLEGVSTVPEPGTLALFAAGLLGCALILRRRRAIHRR